MVATPFTEAQVRRAVKGALDAGFPLGAVEIMRDGTIRLLPATEKPATVAEGPKPW